MILAYVFGLVVMFYLSSTPISEAEYSYDIHQRNEEEGAVALLRVGLMATSPDSPSAAITIETLELYHRLRRNKASMSIQAMVKTLCDIHNVSCCFD